MTVLYFTRSTIKKLSNPAVLSSFVLLNIEMNQFYRCQVMGRQHNLGVHADIEFEGKTSI